MARIVTFGEAMIRLAPPHHQRIEQARSFDIEIGGAELNCGVGLSKLGHHVEWVSALPDNSLGRLVRNRVREAGVDDKYVQFSKSGRCGVNFFEFGSPPRASEVLYDRAHSSMSRITPDSFDWNAILHGKNWLHVTGITPALGEGAAGAVREVIKTAKLTGVKISFDLNYRSKLWPVEHASSTLGALISGVDLLFASPGDADLLFGIGGVSFEEIAGQLTDQFSVGAVACLRREGTGSLSERIAAQLWSRERFLESKWYDVETIDRIGSGDAFAAGLIHGFLKGDSASGLETGAAFAAIKQTIPGDLPLASPEEIEAVMAGGSLRVKR
ncbi:MAG: sugar kinase [Gemmataceae bacterium]